MNIELLNEVIKCLDMTYSNDEKYCTYKGIEIVRAKDKLKQLLQAEKQEEIDTSEYSIHESGHVIKKEQEKPESAWEMFRRLNDKYGVYFREKLMKYFETNHSGYMYLCFHKLTEQEVKKIMQEIEKELEE